MQEWGNAIGLIIELDGIENGFRILCVFAIAIGVHAGRQDLQIQHSSSGILDLGALSIRLISQLV